MVNYYTLEEAARILGTSPDELRKMADRNEIRAFRDRGNLRFRNQDIDERARQLGRGSDPDLQIKGGDSPPPRKKEDAVDFELSVDDADVELGSLHKAEQPSSKKRGGKHGPTSPAPKPGSDSDVRLVADGSDVDFRISSDSDVKMVQEPPPPTKKPAPRRKGGIDPQEDSGVRIVPLDSDSDVKIPPEDAESGSAVSLGAKESRSSSDSDIRLHEEPSSSHRIPPKRKSKVEPPVTEEIDLDAELDKAGPKKKTKSQLKAQQPVLPTSSPFEISDPDLKSAKTPPPKKKTVDSSDDFDLTPMSARDQSPLELDSDEEVSLGALGGGRGSGINLQDPADSGISLEKSGSSGDVEVGLDAGTTPPPGTKGATDPSDEFELALDSGTTPSPKGKAGGIEDSDSEFELSLDSDAPTTPAPEASADSDSEFELTLDAEGGLAPLEDESTEERDIFETDFEVPALDEESGSQAVAIDELDTDLESSDFDLAVGEGDIEAEEESHSQVVAIEEEDDEVVVRKKKKRRFDEDEEEARVEDEDEERPGRAPAVAAPASWGVLPAIVMFPTVIVMFLAGLMSFELVRGMWGYHSNNKVSDIIVRPVAQGITGETLPGGSGK